MAWWHRRGQKVVCVQPGNHRIHLDGSITDDAVQVEPGRIYTIEGVYRDERLVSGAFFKLAEFPPLVGHDSALFRPAVNKSSEAGVAALRRHLIGAPVKEPVQ